MLDSIFVDITALDDNFPMKRFVAASEQIEKITTCIKPIKIGDFKVYLYVHGPKGVGKTAITKLVLQKNLSNKFVYVNCFTDRTKHSIMEEVLLQSGTVVRANESTKDLIKRFARMKKKFAICLDECEYITEPEIIKVFVRNANAIIMISNESPTRSKILSTLEEVPIMEIEFKPYSDNELLRIFLQRTSLALQPDVIAKPAVLQLARLSNGSVRIGLQILNFALRETYFKGLRKVSVEDIEFAARHTRRFTLQNSLNNLNHNERTLFEIIKDNKKMTSGKLFNKFRRITNEEVPERTYRYYMTRIKQFGLVRETGSTKGRTYEIV